MFVQVDEINKINENILVQVDEINEINKINENIFVQVDEINEINENYICPG